MLSTTCKLKALLQMLSVFCPHIDIFWNSRWQLLPSWIFTIREFSTFVLWRLSVSYGICLTPFNLEGFQGKWPLHGQCLKITSSLKGHGFVCHGQIWSKSVIKKFSESYEPTFCHQLANRAKTFVIVTTPDLCMCTKFCPYWLGFAGIIPERLIFQTPKVLWLSAYNKKLSSVFMHISSFYKSIWNVQNAGIRWKAT